MMRFFRVAPMFVLGILAAACGGLDNQPLRRGDITGVVAGADPTVAQVTVLGSPSLRSGVDQNGRFHLESLPSESCQLYIRATLTHALRLPVDVPLGGVVDVGTVEVGLASTVEVRVEGPTGLPVSGADVWVADLDDDENDFKTEDEGLVRLPLAVGCYTFSAKRHGDVISKSGCAVEGTSARITLVMPRD